MELILIRHGQTPGNAQHRYVGALDQPLTAEGRRQAEAAGCWPDVARVYVSVLRRTHETARILFPQAEQVVVPDIQEMDFGDFADRSYEDMAGDAAYQAWVDSYCTTQCPGGESRAQFQDRVCAALAQLVCAAQARGEERIIIVAHGGTMMAALDRFIDDPRDYYDWLLGNCEAYRLSAECVEGEIALRVLGSGTLCTLLPGKNQRP